jgi:cytochrome c
MKKIKIAGIVVLAFVFLAIGRNSFAQDTPKVDGKQIFQDKKCIACHSVDAAGIEKKNPNSKAPDLSTIGSKYDAAFLMKFLSKEETINDKKHGMAFKGTDEEFKALADWLASLKPADNK